MINAPGGIYIAAQQFLQSRNFDVTPTATVGLLGAAKAGTELAMTTRLYRGSSRASRYCPS
jgi:hypothetical protein